MRTPHFRSGSLIAGMLAALTTLDAASGVHQETPASQPQNQNQNQNQDQDQDQDQDQPRLGREPKPASGPTSRPAADESLPKGRDLLVKALETMGGRKTLEKIQSSRMILSGTSMGGTQEVEMLTSRPSSYMIRREMGGIEITFGSDGTHSWANTPMGVQPLPEALSEKMANQARIHEVILQVIDEFQEHTTLGIEEFGGVKCYKIKLDKAEEMRDHFVYVDTESHQPVGLRQPSDSGRGQQTVRFMEWKPIGALTLFRKMEIEEGGVLTTVTITGLEFDKVDPSVFEAPDEIKAKADEQSPTPSGNKEG